MRPKAEHVFSKAYDKLPERLRLKISEDEVWLPKSVVVPTSKIGTRLGAGGLRDLANQASQMPAGASGYSPKERAEFRQPKPPRKS
jgi:hypothetical protein